MKTLIILRGVSGSGKSDFANFLSTTHNNAYVGKTNVAPVVVCCADDYHIKDGVYKFKLENLGEAHLQCRLKAFEAMKNETGLVIIANANTKEGDFYYYQELARQFSYKFISLVLENRHGNCDVHNVPENVLEILEKNLRNSLKLR